MRILEYTRPAVEELGMQKYTLPAGTYLYHGLTAEYIDPDDFEAPLWVSTAQEVAEWFRSGRTDHLKQYKEYSSDEIDLYLFKTTQDIDLWAIYSRNELDDFSNYFDVYVAGNRYDIEEVTDVLLNLGFDGWYIPNNYSNGDDILLADISTLDFIEEIKL